MNFSPIHVIADIENSIQKIEDEDKEMHGTKITKTELTI